MKNVALTEGRGRTKIQLAAYFMGNDLLVCISNRNAHIGAVAIGDFDPISKRTSTSVLTRLGHKDDTIAQKAAYLINKSIKKPVCVIVGIHLPNITGDEIEIILQNADILVNKLREYLEARTPSTR
jgi:hypothetical protein